VSAKLAQLGIAVVHGKALRVEPHVLVVQPRAATAAQDADTPSLLSLPFDHLVWATGAAASPLLGHSQLPVTADGFVRVSSTLRVVGSECIFAAGDCCHFDAQPLPKAGVYAVRMGPIVAQNLINLMNGQELLEYRPQREFLALLNTCDGEAISCWYKTSFTGSSVMALKDKIDRSFMARFQIATMGPPPSLPPAAPPPIQTNTTADDCTS